MSIHLHALSFIACALAAIIIVDGRSFSQICTATYWLFDKIGQFTCDAMAKIGGCHKILWLQANQRHAFLTKFYNANNFNTSKMLYIVRTSVTIIGVIIINIIRKKDLFYRYIGEIIVRLDNHITNADFTLFLSYCLLSISSRQSVAIWCNMLHYKLPHSLLRR